MTVAALTRLRNLHNGSQPTNRGCGEILCLHYVDEADAIVLGPDGVEPMTDIPPEHKRIGGGIATLLLVGDKGREWNGGQVYLFGRHFRELRDRQLDRI